MMSMEKTDKNSNIERLLQAVETPDNFDEKELEAVMNEEETKDFYSLLSDIETVKSIDNAPLPDVNAEWNNFARWLSIRRLRLRGNKLRKINNWHAYISMAAVVLFVLFISVPLMKIDRIENDAAIVHTTDEVVVGLNSSDKSFCKKIGEWDNDMFFDYRITPAHSYTLPKNYFDLETDFMVDKILGLSTTSLEYLFDNFSKFDEISPFNITIGEFTPKEYSYTDAFFVENSDNN